MLQSIKNYIIERLFNSIENYKIKHFQRTINTLNFKRREKYLRFGIGANILNPQYIEIGENFKAGERVRIEAIDKYGEEQIFTPNIYFGNNVSIQNDFHIGCINKVTIGNGCLIASRVFITDHLHGEITKESLSIPPENRALTSKGEINIQDNVWIGEGVTILPNVNIGSGCIIGANSVVTKSFPSNSIIAGVPARVIKHL